MACPLYEAAVALASPLPLTPLEDQRLAGLIMWIPNIVYLGAGLFSVSAWLRAVQSA